MPTGTTVEFCLLGPVEAVDGEQRLPLGGPHPRALIASLLLSPGEVVSNDRLIEAVWNGSPPPSALNLLQGYVSGLRKVLGRESIATHPTGYSLTTTGSRDVDRFESLVASARQARANSDPRKAAAQFREALALWRGQPLADVAYASFAQPEIARLEDARLCTVEELAETELDLGLHRELIGHLEAIVAGNPLRERPRELLMLALYRSGRQAEALELYRRTRELLVEELGLEPGQALQELNRAILSQTVPAAPAPAHGEPAPRPLPAAANPLIGRTTDLRTIRELLVDEARLVTISGAGGSGKTRLALEIAHMLAGQFDTVTFVELAPFELPELVPAAIAEAFNVSGAPGEPLVVTLADRIGERSTLLVLDNFEHVVEGAAAVAVLLASCPRLKVLVASRSPLRLSGEHEYPLDPLPLDDAATLFVARARAHAPDFDAEPAVVAAICERLDALPLALELAAARTRILAPPELLARLDRRLELLTAGPRDLPSRQQTLRATIDWSHDLLDTSEQALLARLGVFAGGCTYEAGERVGGLTLDALASLIEHSLVRRRDANGMPPRFWLLETIREYALERLGAETADIRRAHASYFVGLAESAQVQLRGPEQPSALAHLDEEVANLRAALAWTLEAAPDLAVRLAAALGQFWAIRGQFREARSWLDAVVALPESDSPRGAIALLAAGNFASYDNDLVRARELYERGLALAQAHSLPSVPSFLLALGQIGFAQGDVAEARTHFGAALVLQRAAGDEKSVALTLDNLGLLAVDDGDVDAADALLLESAAAHRRLGDTANLVMVLPSLAYVRYRQGRVADGDELVRESLQLALQSRNQLGTIWSVVVGACGLADRDPEAALRMLGAAEAASAEVGMTPERFDARVRKEIVEVASPQLDEEIRGRATATGLDLRLDEAAAVLLERTTSRAPVSQTRR